MGLIKAIGGSAGGVLADQWREFFYCDSISNDVLLTKGQKRITKRSSNTRGEDNIITDGSIVAINEGQAMAIVEQGEIVEYCDVAGEFVYNSKTSPSMLTGRLMKGFFNSSDEFKDRFTFGGSPGVDQRVYYFNTKHICSNLFGTPAPVPFKIIDKEAGISLSVNVRCNGEYSFQIINPVLFFKNVCGNVEDEYRKSGIIKTMKSELISALNPAFSAISSLGISYDQIPAHQSDLLEAIDKALEKKWTKLRGMKIVSISINSTTLGEEDFERLKKWEDRSINRDATMAAATLIEAQSEAMKSAAENDAGAMMGFMGMNMANQSTGFNAQNLFQMGQSQKQSRQPEQPESNNNWKCSCGATNTGNFCTECAKPKPSPKNTWKCSCGATNTGNFCTECANPKPKSKEGWECSCGNINRGKFCSECGKRKPAGAPLYECDKCGWIPKDPKNPPNFCPECGDRFDDEDIK